MDFPKELKDFDKIFQDICYRHNSSSVFYDFITLVVCFFSRGNMDNEFEQTIKKYKDDELKLFDDLLRCMIITYNKQIDDFDNGWYDGLGDYYMYIASKGHQKIMGQFFTPKEVVDMMVQFTCGKSRKQINQALIFADNSGCGAGRMLLALNQRNSGNFIHGVDLDKLCCMISAINCCIHGCIGEIVWADALLEPINFPEYHYGGYVINFDLNITGIPSIVKLDKGQKLDYNKIPMNDIQSVNWTIRKFKNMILSLESQERKNQETIPEIVEVKTETKKMSKKELKEKLQLKLF